MYKDYLDVCSGSVAIATFLGWLPEIAAAMSILWALIRLYEWIRDKGWRGKKNANARRKK